MASNANSLKKGSWVGSSSAYKRDLSRIKGNQRKNAKDARKLRRQQQKQFEDDVAKLRELEAKNNLGNLLNTPLRAKDDFSSVIIESRSANSVSALENEELDDMLSELSARPKIYFSSRIECNNHALGIKYEKYIAQYYRSQMFDVEFTPLTHDYGVDIIARKHGETIVIQCKYWENFAGVDSVQQVFSGKAYYDADIAIVVTNNGYTVNAKTLADKIGVSLLVIKMS